MVTEKQGKIIAKKLDVKFNGLWEFPNSETVYCLTDHTQTKSTFIAKNLQDARIQLEKTREKYRIKNK